MGLIDQSFVSSCAAPCVYGDAPFGSVKLLHGSFGPLEIIKSASEAEEMLAQAEFSPKPTLRHEASVATDKK